MKASGLIYLISQIISDFETFSKGWENLFLCCQKLPRVTLDLWTPGHPLLALLRALCYTSITHLTELQRLSGQRGTKLKN